MTPPYAGIHLPPHQRVGATLAVARIAPYDFDGLKLPNLKGFGSFFVWCKYIIFTTKEKLLLKRRCIFWRSFLAGPGSFPVPGLWRP